jgi:hypothetical protein
MEFLQFIWWAFKRILTIVVVTWGQLEMINKFTAKTSERVHEAVRYILFMLYAFITSGVYDFKYIPEQGMIAWEVYALGMACIVCYQPIKKAIHPTISKILDKLAK